MRTLFVLDNTVVSDGLVVDGTTTVMTGPPGAIALPVDDNEPATVHWQYDPATQVFSPPADRYETRMTPGRFRLQFTLQERDAIQEARDYVPLDPSQPDQEKAAKRRALNIFFGDLEDPKLTDIDVADPSVVGGLEWCVANNFLKQNRADTIKKGILVSG